MKRQSGRILQSLDVDSLTHVTGAGDPRRAVWGWLARSARAKVEWPPGSIASTFAHRNLESSANEVGSQVAREMGPRLGARHMDALLEKRRAWLGNRSLNDVARLP